MGKPIGRELSDPRQSRGFIGWAPQRRHDPV